MMIHEVDRDDTRSDGCRCPWCDTPCWIDDRLGEFCSTECQEQYEIYTNNEEEDDAF